MMFPGLAKIPTLPMTIRFVLFLSSTAPVSPKVPARVALPLEYRSIKFRSRYFRQLIILLSVCLFNFRTYANIFRYQHQRCIVSPALQVSHLEPNLSPSSTDAPETPEFETLRAHLNDAALDLLCLTNGLKRSLFSTQQI